MMNLLLALALTVDGSVVYQWVDEDGVTHYTDNLATIPNGAPVTTTTGADINVLDLDGADDQSLDGAEVGDEGEWAPLPHEAVLTPGELEGQREAIAAQQGEVSSVDDFVEPLSASGRWVEVDGYRAWQPSTVVVGADFVPYQTHGHWEWTTAGWVFVSDFDWGWAAFHYGRWWQSPVYGWLWYPSVTWGPAWVTWRFGGGYAGWAPLWPRHVHAHAKPRWCFVRAQHLGDRHFWRHAVAGATFARAVQVTAPLPHRAHGPSIAGVQRWGGSVPIGGLDGRPGHGRGRRGEPGADRAPTPSSSAGGHQAPLPSQGPWGHGAPPPSQRPGGGFAPLPMSSPQGGGGRGPSSDGFRAPPPSVGRFDSNSSAPRVPPPSSSPAPGPGAGGFRAPPPSAGFGGASAPAPSPSPGPAHGGGFGTAPSPSRGPGGFHAPLPSVGLGGAGARPPPSPGGGFGSAPPPSRGGGGFSAPPPMMQGGVRAPPSGGSHAPAPGPRGAQAPAPSPSGGETRPHVGGPGGFGGPRR